MRHVTCVIVSAAAVAMMGLTAATRGQDPPTPPAPGGRDVQKAVERPNAGPDPRRPQATDAEKPATTAPAAATTAPAAGNASRSGANVPATGAVKDKAAAPRVDAVYPSSQSLHVLPSPQTSFWPTTDQSTVLPNAEFGTPGIGSMNAASLFGAGYELYWSGQHASALERCGQQHAVRTLTHARGTTVGSQKWRSGMKCRRVARLNAAPDSTRAIRRCRERLPSR